jgi:thymidylate kinase
MAPLNDRSRAPRQPLLISFSGIDGSGKSTQIDNLIRYLEDRGIAVKTLAFWDDVVVFSVYREGFVHAVYGSERGIGAPDRPVNRRDKNVRSWYLNLARHFLYLADALHLRIVVRKARRLPVQAIIMDRYIYDELANLPLSNPLTRWFARVLEWLVPRPDVAYLLDADPEAARARKPEYPVDFMRECRASYFRLAALVGSMTVIRPLPISAAQAQVEGAIQPLVTGTVTPSGLTAHSA